MNPMFQPLCIVHALPMWRGFQSCQHKKNWFEFTANENQPSLPEFELSFLVGIYERNLGEPLNPKSYFFVKIITWLLFLKKLSETLSKFFMVIFRIISS